LDGELETLKLLGPFLGTDAYHSDRIDFISGRKGIEVWTPISIRPQLRALMYVDKIGRRLTKKLGQFQQIVYSPWSMKPVVSYSKSRLPNGIVLTGAEILLETYKFQNELARAIMKEARRRQSKFLKEGIRGTIAIDIRHLTAINPMILKEKLRQQFKTGDSRALDGILLITTNPYAQNSKRKLLVVPNPHLATSISEEDYSEITIKEPLYAPYIYAMPMLVQYYKEGLTNIIERKKDGMLLLNNQEVTRSLVADITTAITCLDGKFSNTKFFELRSGRNFMKIPLK